MSIELVMPSNKLVFCPPLLLLPSVFPSIRIFSNESVLCIRWPKYWRFSISINPSSENSGWFPLGLTGLISLLSKGLSRVFSSTTVQKHQFFGAQPFLLSRTSLVAQMVKRLSTMWETRVQALGWEDPLEKEMAIHSSTIAWKIPRTEEPARLQSMGSQRVGHNWATSLSLSLTSKHDYWKNHSFD